MALAQDAGALPPPQSQDQVNHALAQIAPAFAGKNRFIATGGPGSIEAAIAAHVPTVFHAVDEGTLRSGKTKMRNARQKWRFSGGGRFCIDRWECAVDERAADGTLTPHAIFEPLANGHTYVAKRAPNVTPQAYASGASALLACNNAGKRLCAPVEWRAAVWRIERLRIFRTDPRACRKNVTTPDVRPCSFFTRRRSHTGRGFDGLELNDPRNDQFPDTIAKTGSSPDCVTDEGVFDMVGNLDEWTADANGTFQGGYWLDTTQHGDGCAYRTIAHEFAYHDYSLGFFAAAPTRFRFLVRPAVLALSRRTANSWEGHSVKRLILVDDSPIPFVLCSGNGCARSATRSKNFRARMPQRRDVLESPPDLVVTDFADAGNVGRAALPPFTSGSIDAARAGGFADCGR